MSSSTAALVATLLPWLCGSMMARLLSGPGRSILLYLGQGYILGILVVVSLTKAWDTIGWPLDFKVMAGILALLTTLASVEILRRKAPARKTLPDSADPGRRHPPIWQRAIILLLCFGIGAHLLAVTQELLLRPTFPWDAWRGWEPKAIQFFTNRSLQAPMGTIGNYGDISTQALLWMMLASNTTHEPFLHLPWLMLYGALAATVYGYLRERASSVVATTGAYMVLSLPYLNIHVALAGYADIWLALAFTIGTLALADFRRNPLNRTLIVTVLMIIACFQVKRAGAGFAAVLATLLAIEIGLRANRPFRIAIIFLFASVAGAAGAALSGYLTLDISLPRDYRLLLTSEEFRITGLLRFTFEPAWIARPFFEAISQFGSWHLTLYLWTLALILAIAYRQWQVVWSTEVLAVLCGTGVITGYFMLAAPQAALDHTGLSRSLLYIMPLAISSLLDPLRTAIQSTEATKVQPDTPLG